MKHTRLLAWGPMCVLWSAPMKLVSKQSMAPLLPGAAQRHGLTGAPGLLPQGCDPLTLTRVPRHHDGKREEALSSGMSLDHSLFFSPQHSWNLLAIKMLCVCGLPQPSWYIYVPVFPATPQQTCGSFIRKPDKLPEDLPPPPLPLPPPTHLPSFPCLPRSPRNQEIQVDDSGKVENRNWALSIQGDWKTRVPGLQGLESLVPLSQEAAVHTPRFYSPSQFFCCLEAGSGWSGTPDPPASAS
jgi:hypothetical protein